jgi:hypothetical protein
MKLFLLSIFAFITLNSQAQYFLYWNDEFEQAEINSANWTHEIGASGWGNNELQYYTNSPNNSFIENLADNGKAIYYVNQRFINENTNTYFPNDNFTIRYSTSQQYS